MFDRRWTFSVFFLMLFGGLGALVVSGCGDDGTTGPPDLTAGCSGCHTDAELLQATASPDTTVHTDPGES
jgi:hypothetical protein